MDFDLQQRLHDLNRAQVVSPEPVPTDRVLTRVHRRRAIRTTAVGLASAAVVIGAAVLVNAAPWNATPIPPATPTPGPTQDTTPDPTPDPTPDAEDSVVDPGPAPVGLSVDGDLVELDPADGTVMRTIASDPAWVGPLALDRERGHVYVTRDLGWDSGTWPGTVQRVSIADGAVVDVGSGHSPALTADGRTLAYVSTTSAEDAFTLTIADVDGGATRTILDSAGDTLARAVGPLAWSADGTRLYLQVGWADAPFGELVLAVDPANDTAFDDGSSALRPRDVAQSWSRPAVLADGRLVVTVSEPGPEYQNSWPESERPEWETGEPDSVEVFAAVVDPASREILERVEIPGVDVDQVVAVSPDGRIAFLDTRTGTWALYLSGADGVLEIGSGSWGQDTAADTRIRAVAW